MYLFFPRSSPTASSTSITGLHLQHRTEQGLRCGGQELYLSIRVQAVQVGTLRRQGLIYVGMVRHIVGVGRNGEPWS